MIVPSRELKPADQELIEFARRIVDANTDREDGVHTMGAAVRGIDGKIYGGINLYHFTGGPAPSLSPSATPAHQVRGNSPPSSPWGTWGVAPSAPEIRSSPRLMSSWTAAVTVDASTEVVLPWLLQLGKHRAGRYLPGGIERYTSQAAGPDSRETAGHGDRGGNGRRLGKRLAESDTARHRRLIS